MVMDCGNIILNSNTSVGVINNSILINCNIKNLSVFNSILINVTANHISAQNSVIYNVFNAKSLNLNEEVMVNVIDEKQNIVVLKNKLSELISDGRKSWKKNYKNQAPFYEIYFANLDIDISKIEKIKNIMFAN